MTNQNNKKPLSTDTKDTVKLTEASAPSEQEAFHAKVGSFITINGQRQNLEKIRTYGRSDDTTINLVWDSGLPTSIRLQNKAEVDALMDRLDSYCL